MRFNENHMRRLVLMLLLSFPLLFSCRSVKEHELDETMRSLSVAGELVTCEYTVSKVIKADDMVPWKIGERKILFTCKAYLQAGVDMSSYNPEKTVADPERKSIILVLPAPKLLSVNIPVEQIKQEYSHVTGLRFEFTAEERASLLKQGEASIRAEVSSMGILRDARINAESYFTALLTDLGYKDINIYFER